MIVKKVVIPYTHSNPLCRIYGIGDAHVGTVFHAEDKHHDKLKIIRDDPIARFVEMGDKGEFITPADKRHDPNNKLYPKWLEDDDIADCLEKRITSVYKPVANKCDGMILGNHENEYRRHNFGNVHKHICDNLGVDDLGFVAIIHYIFKRENSSESHLIKGAFTHGTSGASTKNGKKSALKKFMDNFPDCDFYFYAHTHDIDNVEIVELVTTSQLKPKERIRHGVLTGCFFKTYQISEIPSYGEYKLYPPTRIGCASVLINADNQTIEPETLETVG